MISPNNFHHIALVLGTISEADLGRSGDGEQMLSQGTHLGQMELSTGQVTHSNATSPDVMEDVGMLLHKTGTALNNHPAIVPTASERALCLSQLQQLLLQSPQGMAPGLYFLLI